MEHRHDSKSLPARLVLTQARLATGPALWGAPFQTFTGHVAAKYDDLNLVQHVEQENRGPINNGGFLVGLCVLSAGVGWGCQGGFGGVAL